MRLLPERNDDCRCRVTGQKTEAPCGPETRLVPQPRAIGALVPLRNLLRHYRCRATRRETHARSRAMSNQPIVNEAPALPTSISRRGFVKTGGGLVVSMGVPLRFAAR